MLDTDGVWGKVNVGILFSETLEWDAEEIAHLARFDHLYAGSTWNQKILDAKGREFGVELKVGVFKQGVEPELWAGGEEGEEEEEEEEEGHFVIFSGGKLEPRKGQDILIAAFRIFQKMHGNARLVFAWQNDWPETVKGMGSRGLVEGEPEWDGGVGGLKIVEWLGANGIDTSKVTDLGRPGQSEMAGVLRRADVAVFTNRCEGGTNLIAMESLATGVCTILSSNTGHLDLVEKVCKAGNEGAAGCLVLEDQKEGANGWWESSVEEVVKKLEEVYGDKERGRRGEIGRRGKDRIWSWGVQIDKIVDEIESCSVGL